MRVYSVGGGFSSVKGTESLFFSDRCSVPLKSASNRLSTVAVGALTFTSDTACEAVDFDRRRFVVVDDDERSNRSSTSSTGLSLTDNVGEFSDSVSEDENTPRDPELPYPFVSSSDSLSLRILELYPCREHDGVVD